jgi:hypothetical protein
MSFKPAPRKTPELVQVRSTIMKTTGPFKIPKWLMINSAACFVLFLLVALLVRDAFFQEAIAQCSDRYGNGTAFGLQDRNGTAVSTTDLQSRLGGRDWGILENTKVQAIKDGPAQVAMLVALPKLPAASDTGVRARSGMGFTWLLPNLAAARAACLTYDIWLPADFDFGKGGALPGLFGSDDALRVQKPLFATRHAWGSNGTAQVRMTTLGRPGETEIPIDVDRLKLATGRWVRVEQEVELNDPGEANGRLRVWIDGVLHFTASDYTFRADDRGQFRGVIADVHYGANGTDAAAIPKAGEVRLTPFVVRWQ